MLLNILQYRARPTTTENYPTLNVNSVKAERFCTQPTGNQVNKRFNLERVKERISKQNSSNLFTKWLEIDPERERITACFLVSFTLHKIKIKS